MSAHYQLSSNDPVTEEDYVGSTEKIGLVYYDIYRKGKFVFIRWGDLPYTKMDTKTSSVRYHAENEAALNYKYDNSTLVWCKFYEVLFGEWEGALDSLPEENG